MGEDDGNIADMNAPLANPLYHHWRTVANARGGTLAVREVASGREWSFADLHELAVHAPPSPAVLHAPACGLGLVIDVLRAWRDGTVLVPDDGTGMPAPPPELLGSDVCHLKITSGSTGTPRWVKFRAEQLAADAAQIVATMGLRTEWPNLGVISMAHSYGFSSLVLPLLLYGVPLLLLDNPLPETLRRAMRTTCPLTLPAVPAMWQAWDRVSLDFTPIRLAISAGAPMPVALEAAVFARTGLKIHNFYGSSECGGIAYDRTDSPRDQATLVGTPMAGVTLALDPASGCLQITSAAVADGYLHPDPSTATAGGPGGGTWLSQDLARLDGQGAVHLLGRAGDCISVAGHKLAPAVLEEVLQRVAGVRGCVVFGVPSPNAIRVEDVVACVKLEPGTDLNLLKSALGELPTTYLPRHWWQCDDLEPDARGKISRARWREQWLAQQG
ncbi:MAG: AMP-binding protein [Verrucomicrobia bacterium]|nr:AMP-binding protein [Verrucomicrobiota bacterium]